MKFSKVLAIILSAVLFLSAVPAVTFADDADAARVVIDSVSAVRGDTAEVNISFKDVPGITSAAFEVLYPAGITLDSVVFNSALGGMSGTGPSLDSPAVLNWLNGGKDFSGDFLFAKLVFTVDSNAQLGEKQISLVYNQADICDIYEEEIALEVVNGKITVINCAHTNTAVEGAVAAKCTVDGATGKTVCLDCGKVLAESTVIPAAGHTFGNWIVDSVPNAANSGEKHRICSVCGEVSRGRITATDPIIKIDSVQARTSKTVDVTVSLINNPGIAALKADIVFDNNLKLKKVEYNKSLSGLTNDPYSKDSPVTLNWSVGITDVTEDLVFATLTFEIPANMELGFKDITLTYDPEDVANMDDENVDFAVVNGGIEVIKYIPGDINDDGKVNNKDLTRLFQYLSKWNVAVNKDAIDVNGDGKVNNKDLTRLFQYLSKWDVQIF